MTETPTISLGPRSHHSLDDLEASATTPAGNATLWLRGRDQASFSLAPGRYERSTDADLSRQLTQLARLAFAAWTRAYFQLRSRDFGERVAREPAPMGARDREYDELRGRLVATGSSPDGRVRVTAAGLEHWVVEVEPGTVDSLDEASFCAAVGAAARDVLVDQFRQVRRLKDEVYG